MSPREKGRFLRQAGWKSVAFRGIVTWLDPLRPSAGAMLRNEAFAVASMRERLRRREQGEKR